MRGDPKKPQTFRLSASATKALDVLAWEHRLSKTDVLEKLLVGEIVVRGRDGGGMTMIEAVANDEVIAAAYRQGGAVREAIERAWKMASHA